MNINSPRRILVVGAPRSGKLTFLKALTGSLPTNIPTSSTSTTAGKAREQEGYGGGTRASHAGLSHVFNIKTKYYSAVVPVWVDEWVEAPDISQSTSSEPKAESMKDGDAGKVKDSEGKRKEDIEDLEDDPIGLHPWAQNYHSPASKPVLDVLGAIVLCFRKPPRDSGVERNTVVDRVKEVVEVVGGIARKCGEEWDGVCLAVAMPRVGGVVAGNGGVEEEAGGREEDELELLLEEVCRDEGFEYVDFEAKNGGAGREMALGEYRESFGLPRILEALHSNDWSQSNPSNPNSDDDHDLFGSDAEDNSDPSTNPFFRGPLDFEANEFEREMLALRREIWRDDEKGGDGGGSEGEEEGDDEARQVEELERVMGGMRILKDMQDSGAGERERRKLAREVLREILKERG
ncbi:hypothetical protein BDZ91DRAFT_849349 [Kalaharituber pfeilii]|nr:hypothetical protein BDZ91DRAFT_849349 [Kalaharituber pfeilii]